MSVFESTVLYLGALAFGVVMGWVTYRTLRYSQVNGIADIGAVIGAVGGAAVTALYAPGTALFGTYCIGLAVGFFAYLSKSLQISREVHGGKLTEDQVKWLGEIPTINVTAAPTTDAPLKPINRGHAPSDR